MGMTSPVDKDCHDEVLEAALADITADANLKYHVISQLPRDLTVNGYSDCTTDASGGGSAAHLGTLGLVATPSAPSFTGPSDGTGAFPGRKISVDQQTIEIENTDARTATHVAITSTTTANKVLYITKLSGAGQAVQDGNQLTVNAWEIDINRPTVP